LFEEPFAWYVEGGVELPSAEFKVEEDLVVGTVPWDSLEDPEVRKLALDRRRSSLKKGIGSARTRRRWCPLLALEVMSLELKWWL
jgi:hypothetical protein